MTSRRPLKPSGARSRGRRDTRERRLAEQAGRETDREPNRPSPDETDEAAGDRFHRHSGDPVKLDPTVPIVFEGFDDEKLRAPLRLAKNGLPQSAKYTFAKLAMTARSMPLTPSQAEDWFKAHIADGLEAKGFRVGWVRRDQALIGTREHPEGELITFVRGAGGANPVLCWECEVTRAKEIEVTQLTDDPAGAMSDPLHRAQAELARRLAREEQASQQRLDRELRSRLRATRIPHKG